MLLTTNFEMLKIDNSYNPGWIRRLVSLVEVRGIYEASAVHARHS